MSRHELEAFSPFVPEPRPGRRGRRFDGTVRGPRLRAPTIRADREQQDRGDEERDRVHDGHRCQAARRDGHAADHGSDDPGKLVVEAVEGIGGHEVRLRPVALEQVRQERRLGRLE